MAGGAFASPAFLFSRRYDKSRWKAAFVGINVYSVDLIVYSFTSNFIIIISDYKAFNSLLLFQYTPSEEGERSQYKICASCGNDVKLYLL